MMEKSPGTAENESLKMELSDLRCKYEQLIEEYQQLKLKVNN